MAIKVQRSSRLAVAAVLAAIASLCLFSVCNLFLEVRKDARIAAERVGRQKHRRATPPTPLKQDNNKAPALPEEPPSDDREYVLKACRDHPVGLGNCPQLFVIGTQKGGTTTLARWIETVERVGFGTSYTKNHYGQRKKETHFYTELPEEARTNATELYARTRGYIDGFGVKEKRGSVAVEGTPSYMALTYVPELLVRSGVGNRQSRFLIILRDPVDRFVSGVNMVTGLRGKGESIDALTFHPEGKKENIEEFGMRMQEEIAKCRSSAADHERHKACTTHLNRKDHGDAIDQLYRGVYVDQLRWWLNFFEPDQFCILASSRFATEPLKALSQHASRCLNDVGIKISDLPREVENSNVARKKYSFEDSYPNLRAKLNKNLFDATNRELKDLLREKWGIENFAI